ncbi:MAG: hypothetical protein LLF89_05930 [Spirochaetaceae bacterium]|nr:hypothetical protein [Spirochaetaceae bacterium]
MVLFAFLAASLSAQQTSSVSIGVARFIQVADPASGEELFGRIGEGGLEALAEAAGKAIPNKLDNSLPAILISRLEPLPYRLSPQDPEGESILTFSLDSKNGLFLDSASLATKGSSFLAGFYAVKDGRIYLWLLGFAPAGSLPEYSAIASSDISQLESLPDSLLAGICSWAAGERLSLLDLDLRPQITDAPEIQMQVGDPQQAYIRGKRIFIRESAGSSAFIFQVKAKGFKPASLSARADQQLPAYRKEVLSLESDGTLPKLEDAFHANTLAWSKEKAYRKNLDKFRTSLGFFAISLPLTVISIGCFSQYYEAASRSGENSAWLYASGAVTAVCLGSTIAFLVNAGINLAACLGNSE